MSQENVRINFIADIEQLQKALKTAGGKVKQFGKSVTKAGKSLSVKLSAPLALAGGIALKQAANFEKLRTTLNVLTGSAEEGGKAFERLVKFSAQTPFQLDALVQANNTMMGFGLSADDAFKSLQQLGDIAAVSGGDLGRIAVAFGQSAAEGRVMTRDILQFINNGVPMYELLADVTGKSAGEVRQLASEGKITFDVLQAAFSKATSEGGKFHGGMNTLSKTLGGLFSTLKDNLNIAFAGLGEEIAKAFNLSKNIPKLTRFIGNLTEKFKSLSPQTKRFIVILGGLGIVLPPILVAIGTLMTIGPGILVVIKALAGPIGLVVAGLTAVATVIVKNWKPIKNAIYKVINYFIDLYNEAVGFRVLVEGIRFAFKTFYIYGKTYMNALWEVIKGVAKAIGGVFSGVGTIIKGAFTLNFDTIKQGLNEIKDNAANSFKEMGKNIESTVKKGANDVKDEFNKALINIGGTKNKVKIVSEVSGDAQGTVTSTDTTSSGGLSVMETEDKIRSERIKMNRKAFLDDVFKITDEGQSKLEERFNQNAERLKQPLTKVNGSLIRFNQRMKEELERAAQITQEASMIVTGGFQNMAEGIAGGLANAIINGGNLANSLASVVLGAIGTMAIQLGQLAIKIGIAMKAIKMSFKKPGFAIAAGIALIVVGKLIQSAASIVGGGGGKAPKKFANGGIVSTPTLGLFGEYPGARSNPEVVAPLDKLKNMIGERGSSQVRVGGEFRVKGQDLVVALERANKFRERVQ